MNSLGKRSGRFFRHAFIATQQRNNQKGMRTPNMGMNEVAGENDMSMKRVFIDMYC